jgi:hypothetical protein
MTQEVEAADLDESIGFDESIESASRYLGAGILFGRLPSQKPTYEPPIVATLRQHFRRGASLSFLHRLAGGVSNFNTMNAVWAIGSTRAPAPTVDSIDVVLSPQERRIALLQMVVEYARQGRIVPSVARLGAFLGASNKEIDTDINWLRAKNKVTTRPGRPGWYSRTVHLAAPFKKDKQ